jgi:hypothetical protein
MNAGRGRVQFPRVMRVLVVGCVTFVLLGSCVLRGICSVVYSTPDQQLLRLSPFIHSKLTLRPMLTSLLLFTLRRIPTRTAPAIPRRSGRTYPPRFSRRRD